MISQLQLEPPWPVKTIHGDGLALVLIDYGPLENGCFLVVNKANGKMRYYNVLQTKLSENFTFGINEPSPVSEVS